MKIPENPIISNRTIKTQLLESALSNSNELKFFLGHEIAHLFFRKDFGSRFNIFMTPFYHSGREQTCDNAGLTASGNLNDSITALRMLSAGHTLSANVNTEELVKLKRFNYIQVSMDGC